MNPGLQIDRICDRFESAWKSGSVPVIADYLTEAEPEFRPDLLSQLIAVDIDYRRRKGEPTDCSQYAALGDDARRIALHELQRSKADDVDQASADAPHLDPTILSDASGTLDQSLIDSVRLQDASTVPPTSTSLPPVRADHPQHIGRYPVLQELSSGGQGRVYRALHPNMPLEVAIKVSVNTADGATHRALMDESRILCDLQHPHIARILDVDFDEHEHPFVVLEYVRGLSLQQRLKSESIELEEAVTLMETLAAALDYAHQRGVLHLDLKPGNIVFNESGDPKIIDFGLARLNHAWTDPVEPNFQISGTPAYMPPEQAAGQTDQLDRRSDLFSLAAILYQVLTGQKLYSGNAVEQIRQAQQADFSDQPLMGAAVPDQVRTVCQKALAKNMEDRFATVSEFAATLRQAVDTAAQQPPSASPDDLPAAARQGKPWYAKPVVLLPAFALFALGTFLLANRPGPGRSGVVSEATEGELTDNMLPKELQLRVEITHFRLNQDYEISAEGKWMELGAPRENEFLRWDVIPSQPAHFRLIALNPDGVVQVAYSLPGDHPSENASRVNAVHADNLNQDPLQEFHFPGQGQGWGLTDGVGQQAFLLLASAEPLPPGAQLVELLELSDWDPSKESGSWIWEHGSLSSQRRSKLRGGVAELPGKTSFAAICRRISSYYPDAALHAVSFPVRPGITSSE